MEEDNKHGTLSIASTPPYCFIIQILDYSCEQ